MSDDRCPEGCGGSKDPDGYHYPDCHYPCQFKYGDPTKLAERVAALDRIAELENKLNEAYTRADQLRSWLDETETPDYDDMPWVHPWEQQTPPTDHSDTRNTT